MKNNHYNLTSIPKELFNQGMPFDYRVANQLAATSKFFSSFRMSAYSLMGFLTRCRYQKAKALVSKNPELMFQTIYYQFESGAEHLSPLQYAFKTFDTHAWRIFLSCVQDNPDHLKKFIKQMQMQNDGFDIKPLLSAYDKYLKTYNEISFIGLSKNSETLAHLSSFIGKEQRKLPRHFIQEFFRPCFDKELLAQINLNTVMLPKEYNAPTFPWVINHDFQAEKNQPPEFRLFACFEGLGIVKGEKLLIKLGDEYTIVRGDYVPGAYFVTWAGGLVKDDRDILEKIYHTRKEEFQAQLLAFSNEHALRLSNCRS